MNDALLDIEYRYRRDGFAGPCDLLTEEEARETRRHIEQIEATIGGQMQKRFHMKAHLPFPFLHDLITHPKLLDVIEGIVGPNILCWGSTFFQKEAHDPFFVSWHQDTTYYGVEPPDTVTAWIAITEASEAAGCMRFMPGSHNKGIYSHAELRAKDNLLGRGQTVSGIDESRAVHVPLKAGQFSLHREDTLHASHPNKTGDRRIGLSVHYVAPYVREMGFPDAGALLVRGKDTYGYWREEPRPVRDFDPVCMTELDRALACFTGTPVKHKPTD